MLRFVFAALVLTTLGGCASTRPQGSVDQQGQDASKPASRQPAAGERSLGLTIYSSADPAGFDPQQFIAQNQQGHAPHFAWQVPGFGVVRDTRTLDFKQGQNIVSFTDVAQFIDPTTVSLVDLSVPTSAGSEAGLQVLEQKFAFDLVSPEKLLENYVDQQITLNVNQGNGKVEQITGRLLSSNEGTIVLQTASGVRIIEDTSDIQLGQLPGGLITKPTLRWELVAPTAGKRQVRTAYQTGGITWRADYNLIINDDETSADLGAWVTVMNLSGMSYPNAELKLIAGDVQRVTSNYSEFELMSKLDTFAEEESGAFEQKAFFEYHLYTLPRRVTIDQNATQQLMLFPTARQVKVEKLLVYDALPVAFRGWGQPEPVEDHLPASAVNQKVDVYIQFDNRENNKLGIPLPRGKVRAYKMDAGNDPSAAPGSLEFIGEDLIDHTAKNQKVLVRLGQSFEMSAGRTQVDFTIDHDKRVIVETIRITLKNARDTMQQVEVREFFYRWTNWSLLEQSAPHEKIDARTIRFNVEVPPQGEKTVTYTVKYSW